MLDTLNHAAEVIYAQRGGGNAGGINFGNIRVLLGLLGGIILSFIGIVIIMRAPKGNFRKSADTSAGAILGVLIFGLGAAFVTVAAVAPEFLNFLVG